MTQNVIEEEEKKTPISRGSFRSLAVVVVVVVVTHVFYNHSMLLLLFSNTFPMRFEKITKVYFVLKMNWICKKENAANSKLSIRHT